MGTITLESGQFGWDYLVVNEDGRDILVQLDLDYPGIASAFGWSVASARLPTHSHVDSCEECDDPECDMADDCTHDGTDGTIKCRSCGMTALDFITLAHEWLDEHVGDTADDPGYFGDDDDDDR
jgi:hypothetical protein